MIKTFSRKLWISLISCCCIGGGIALACADGWGEEYGVSNFSPEVFVDSSYSPFFYSWQFYYGINYDQNQHTRFNESNIKEWTGFFKDQVSNDELRYWLQTATAAAIDSAANYATDKSKAAPFSMRSFIVLKQKNDKQSSAFFNYLQLAKKAEGFALNDIHEAWDVDTSRKTKVFNATTLNRNLQNGFSKTTDLFLKERYWFQLLRSYFFNGTPQQTIDLFNSTEKNMPHDNIYYRSMGYAAGACYKLKNFSQANYYYSLVYENCNELKTAAHFSFHPQEEKDWNATLNLCRNNDEKATLWQMLGIFYADEQRAINQIYQLNPSSNKLDLLLARAVNKYEQKFDYRGGVPNEALDSALSSLPLLVTKIATAGNAGKPWIWQMAAGYINMLDGKYAVANTWFAKAEKTIPAKKDAQAQFRLLKLINKIGQAKLVDAKFEKDVLAEIEWLKNFDPQSVPGLRYKDAFGWIKQKMAAKYFLQKDFVKSECFYSTMVFYAENKNIEGLKTFLAKPQKTAYEKLCAYLCEKKSEDLFEFQAIRLLYTDSIDAAIEKMEKAGTGAATVLAGNPFNGRIQDCHDCDHAAPQKIKYSKLSFLKKLKEIKDNIKAGQDIYNNAMLLANAQYNTTWYGNARFFYECKVVGDGSVDGTDSLFGKMFYGMDLATKYYTQSLQNATTDEQKAKCQYMLAKCQRNQWYNEDKEGSANRPDFIAWDGFKALKQYANTQYYKDVIKECGYFKTCLRK